MGWQKIVLRASEYLLTRCDWFLRREEIRLWGGFLLIAEITRRQFFQQKFGAKTMDTIITWLISFEKIWLRVVSAMAGNPPLRLWLNDNAMFYKTSFKRSYKEIIAHFRDKHFECCIFNIVQHHQTFVNKDWNKEVASLTWKEIHIFAE